MQSQELDRFLSDVHDLSKDVGLQVGTAGETDSRSVLERNNAEADYKRRLVKIREVYQTHKKAKRELSQFSQGHRRLLNPQVLHTCANLFMSELVEVVVPAVVGICSAILWYQSSGIRQYISYMQEIDEEKFKTGLKYIALEFFIQLVTAFVVFEGLRRMTDVSCSTIGVFLIRKNIVYYILVVPTAVLFFLTSFIEHWGCDPTLEFAWLHKNNNSTIED